MTKKTKKTKKKEAEVLKVTEKLNGILKKRKQEQQLNLNQKTSEVNVEILLEKLPNSKVNKREDGFVELLKGNCSVDCFEWCIHIYLHG